MRFLITNDDGYDAPGLLALHRALSALGEVVVVAPAECHSSKGHAVVTQHSIQVEERRVDGMGRVSIVHSSPADCIRLALAVLLDTPPDYVVAGINCGANIGVDVFYSGTVAAAREAAIMGFQATAVSQYTQPDVTVDWQAVSRLTTDTLRHLLAQTLAPGEFWNVNFPSLPRGRTARPLVFVPQSTEGHLVEFEVVEDGRPGVREFRFTGDYRRRSAAQSADVRHTFEGHVTATRLQLDQTARRAGIL